MGPRRIPLKGFSGWQTVNTGTSAQFRELVAGAVISNACRQTLSKRMISIEKEKSGGCNLRL